jgi:hypothetical protein
MIKIIMICVFLGISGASKSQQKNWTFDGQFNFGCQVFFYNFFKSNNFPGLRAYAGFSAKAIRGDFVLNYGSSVSIYTKAVGANLNPLVSDWQIDLTNSFGLGAFWGGNTNFSKYLRTTHNGDFYNLVIQRRGAFIGGTNFILNNHGRHQTIGFFDISADQFSLNYYNDGGPPFDWLPFADKFDRYWTGGLGFFLHSAKGYNVAELGFDQFTGYKPLLYELSNIIGIKVPLYDGEISLNKKTKKPPNYNTATYHLRVNFDENIGANIGLIGSMVDKKGKFWGLQDIIHTTIKNSLHPNNDATRLFLGTSYNNFQDVKF